MHIKSITTKLFLLLIVLISAFTILLFSHNYRLYQEILDKHTKQSLDLALDFDLAIRKYIETNIRPVMTKFLGPDEFIPETMSTSFVARSIFEDVQNKFPDLILKFSAKNPRNPKNKAGKDEEKIIDFLNANPDQSIWQGNLSIDNQQYIAIFNARRVKESCLRCHGDPQDAPASLVRRYGDKGGFHLHEGQVIATDTIAIRRSKINDDIIKDIIDNSPGLLIAALGLFCLIFLGIKFLFVDRISRISNYFKDIIATGEFSQIEHIESRGDDEIATLAQTFNQLADQITTYHLSLDKEAAERIRTNNQLQNKITEHNHTKTELRSLYDNQDELIKKRTAELDTAYSLLKNKHHDMERLFGMVEKAKHEWEMTMDCISDMVLLVDRNMMIKRCNIAVLNFTGASYKEIIGAKWPEIVKNSGLESKSVKDGTAEYFHAPSGRWFYLDIYELEEEEGQAITLRDFTGQKEAANLLEEKNREIEKAYTELKQAQGQLLQQEKMASIGQLAAGVAHEINNPVGFISSNLGSLNKYIVRLNKFIEFQAELIGEAGEEGVNRQAAERKKLKLDFIQQDILELVDESLDGCERVKKIVMDLKGFSRVDEADKQQADINNCLETTLNIVWNELKYKAKIDKDFGELSTIDCYPQQLNQVFMNLLVNAAQAIEHEGIIKIKTWQDDKFLYIAISDNGQGIPAEAQERIFEPFFTTKEVGKGTGLGLSIVYDIVTKNHNGSIELESIEGKGTTFTVKLPYAEGV